MKSVLTLTCLMLLIGYSSADQPALKNGVSGIAKQLEKELDNDRWSIDVGDDYLEIKSKFKVGTLTRLSFSLGSERQMKNYVIRLSFKDRLSKHEYLALARNRAEHIATVNYGTKTKEEMHRADVFLKNNPLPRYRFTDAKFKDYSVYLTVTGDYSTSVSPLSLYLEAKGVEALVTAHMWPSPR